MRKLQGVPFNYLVPDARMLPPESIRFFQVDRMWIDALLAGASGVATFGIPAPAVHDGTDAAPAIASGFLLRSSAVTGWPGMEIHPFADLDATMGIDIVRLEPVAPAVLLALFAAPIKRIDFREPPEALHFGVDLDTNASTFHKQLRYADGAATGAFKSGAVVPVPLRAGRVVSTDALAQAMAGLVWDGQAPAIGFTAAEFALEMVEGVQTVSFRMGSS